MEFALAASVLFFLIFASLEFARMNMIRHSVDNAAYEAARCVIVPGATASEAEVVARDVMDSAGIRPEEDLKDETHLPTEERPAAKLAKTPSANVDESEDRLSIFEDFLDQLGKGGKQDDNEDSENDEKQK